MPELPQRRNGTSLYRLASGTYVGASGIVRLSPAHLDAGSHAPLVTCRSLGVLNVSERRRSRVSNFLLMFLRKKRCRPAYRISEPCFESKMERRRRGTPGDAVSEPARKLLHLSDAVAARTFPVTLQPAQVVVRGKVCRRKVWSSPHPPGRRSPDAPAPVPAAAWQSRCGSCDVDRPLSRDLILPDTAEQHATPCTAQFAGRSTGWLARHGTIITASQPVMATMAAASSGVRTSPFADDGKTHRILDRSDVLPACGCRCIPARGCVRVGRPAFRPQSSAIFASGTHTMLASDQPMRNLTVNGIVTALRTVSKIV